MKVERARELEAKHPGRRRFVHMTMAIDNMVREDLKQALSRGECSRSYSMERQFFREEYEEAVAFVVEGLRADGFEVSEVDGPYVLEYPVTIRVTFDPSIFLRKP